MNADKSLLAQTIERLLPLAQSSDMIIVTSQNYAYHVKTELADSKATGAHIMPTPALSWQVKDPSTIEYFAPQASYLEHVKAMLDKKTLAGFKGKVLFDVMHGAAMGYPSELAKEYGLNVIELHSEFTPSFGGVNPEPIEKNLAILRQAVMEQKACIGFATDGDGDRIGVIDADGRFINPHQILALLTEYLVEKRSWAGGVVQTMTGSELIKRVVIKYGLRLYERRLGLSILQT